MEGREWKLVPSGFCLQHLLLAAEGKRLEGGAMAGCEFHP